MRFAVYRQVSPVLSSELSSIKRREPTSGLEPLTPAHYECAVMCCRGLHEVANPPYLKGFPFSALPSVAPYCVPGGIRTSDSYSPTAGLMARPRDLRSHNRPTSVSWCFDSRRFDSQASHDL